MKLYAGIGLAVVAVVLGLTLWSNQGSRLILKGTVQKVRIQRVDDMNTAAIVEFRLDNPADFPFTVKSVELMVEWEKGAKRQGEVFRQSDVGRFFDYYKATLGPQYNRSVSIGETYAAHTTADRMVAATFPLPEAELAMRKRIVIRLEASNGLVPTEIEEKR